jgi:predicted ATPase/DNA-binding winged helix-turn-helix (wHTH) protein
MQADREDTECFAFGSFCLYPRQRRLLIDNAPLELGSRAFDILVALIEARGAIVSKNALMDRVWQGLAVTDNNLQVQISALRNALGTDRELIRTIAGRGYQFTGDVRSVVRGGEEQSDAGGIAEASVLAATNLCEPVSDLIGRDVELREVLALAGSHRLITLTGAGGIGKTRLAVEAARQLRSRFPDGVWVADLSSLRDPELVPAAVASAVGLDLTAGEAGPERLAAALGARKLLIVLDTCEHVIDAAAELVEALLRASAGTHVIATSREPLKAYGEWVYRVRPLALPAANETDPLGSRAVSLFVERARSFGAANLDVAVEQSSAMAIAEICRKLDGIPLAIEMAAVQAAALGVQTLADRIDDYLRLLTTGRRTALPRHQTLRATYDWSYGLLTLPERALLHRLAILRGAFELGTATKAAASGGITPADAMEGLDSLVTKSLISADVDGDVVRYRLHHTTRAYALEKRAQCEFDGAGRRCLAVSRQNLCEHIKQHAHRAERTWDAAA